MVERRRESIERGRRWWWWGLEHIGEDNAGSLHRGDDTQHTVRGIRVDSLFAVIQ